MKKNEQIYQDQILTITKLRQYYDQYFYHILWPVYIEPMPRKKDGQHKYKAKLDMPSKEEYLLSRNEIFGLTIPEIIGFCKEQSGQLRDEYEEWKDNLPENLEGSEKADVLDEIIDQLTEVEYYAEQVEDLEDLPDDTIIVFPVMTNTKAARLNKISECLQLLSDHIDNYSLQEAISISESFGPVNAF